MSKQVAVIGGGVIGMASAYALVRAGHQVTLVERRTQPGLEASFANGGQLSYRYVSPLPDAGVPLKAIAWMLQGASAPLQFRPRLSSEQWQWCLSFLAACRRSVNRRNGGHLLRLALYSQAVLQHWREQDGLDGFAWKRNGKLVVYRSSTTFAAAAGKIASGDEQRALSVDECLALEPALGDVADKLAGGIFSASDEAADCYLFCHALERRLQASGRYRRLHDQVTGIRREGSRIKALNLASGSDLAAHEIILAAGNGSQAIATPLGIKLGLYPLKGYSLSLPAASGDGCPQISVTDFDRKMVYARLGGQLRVAAMVDIGARDTGIDPRRMRVLRAHCQDTFPRAGHYPDAREWAGQRPSTATGTPLLGATPYDNFWLNVGHGSLGFTLACASGQILAELIGGAASPIDLTGLRAG